MRLVDSISVFDGAEERSIGLYEGDLARIPADQAVDILVVSAFPDSYAPVTTTLIGALSRRGLSVGDLALAKEHDLRAHCGFWLSKPIGKDHADLNIGRVLCFEPQVLGKPPQVVGELFRGLFPFLHDDHDAVVAVPLIGAGNQGWPAEVILSPLLEAAYEWLSRGLAIRELKIVEVSAGKIAQLAGLFERFKTARSAPRAPGSTTRPYDVFLSYSSNDGEAAQAINRVLNERTGIKVFDFKSSIEKGKSWQQEIDDAIESCRHIIAVMSQAYFASVECQEELMMARLRHKRSGGEVLWPVYWSSLGRELALWLQIINYSDCREKNVVAMTSAVRDFAARLA